MNPLQWVDNGMDWASEHGFVTMIGFIVFVMIPIMLVMIGIILYAGYLLLVVTGIIDPSKPYDPWFYDNGMRCKWEYYLIGKVHYSQKICETLPQLTPVIK